MSEEFDFERIKNKAIEQLKAGKPLLGKDGLIQLICTITFNFIYNINKSQ